MATTETASRPINLLSFDGGGMRGLSSLIILKRIMYGIERQLGFDENSLLPCDYFDLIAGTSTGGLIAVMLGCLKMDVDTCIRKYLELGKTIFPTESYFTKKVGKHGKGLVGMARFDAKVLEQCIKQIISNSESTNGPETTLAYEASRQTEAPKCKVFVCATDKDTKKRFRLRNYDSNEPGTRCTIWQACRATSAAPTFFDHIEFGDPLPTRYVDGGLGMNNPIRALIDEAFKIWAMPTDQLKIGAVISIGTGLKPISSIGNITPTIAKALSEIATDTDEIADEFEAELDRSGPKLPNMSYFRFNVPHGVGDISLEEWEQHHRISGATNDYLNKSGKAVEGCINSMLHQRADTQVRLLDIICDTPVPVSRFQGREREIKSLHNYLDPKKLGQKIVVLWGLPGFGKSQLAVRYQTIFQHEYSYILWADGSSLGSMRDSIFNVARQIDSTLSIGSDNSRAISVVKEFLVKSGAGRWLMIIDSYDTESFDIRTFVPSAHMGPGSLLVTSVRSKIAYDLDAQGIELKGLDEHAGREILLHQMHIKLPSSSTQAAQQAEQVIRELEGMPLAIEIVGAFLHTRGLDIGAFLSAYKSEFESISSFVPRRLQWCYDKNRSIGEILELLLDAISDDETDAIKLLFMSSLLGFSEVPIKLFTNNIPPSESELTGSVPDMATNLGLACANWLEESQNGEPKTVAALHRLEELGLAKLRRDLFGYVSYFSIHNLIRNWSTQRLEEVEKSELTFLLASLLCNFLVCGEIQWSMSVRAIGYARVLKGKVREMINDSELLVPDGKYFDQYKVISLTYGEFFMKHKQFKDAQDAYADAVQCDSLIRQVNQPVAMSSLHLIEKYGLACWRNGELEKAVEVFKTMYQESLEAYGTDHDITIASSRLLMNVKTQLDRRVTHEQNASVALAIPKESFRYSGTGLSMEPLETPPLAGYTNEDAFELLELAKENHEYGIRNYSAVESFRAASEYYRVANRLSDVELWICRAWNVCSDLNDYQAKWGNAEIASKLAHYCVENVPSNIYLSVIPQRALLWAVNSHHEALIECLVRMSVDFKMTNEQGNNLLHRLMMSKSISIRAIFTLIHNGVDPHHPNLDGLTPLDIYVENPKGTDLSILAVLIFYETNIQQLDSLSDRMIWVIALKKLTDIWFLKSDVHDRPSKLSKLKEGQFLGSFNDTPMLSEIADSTYRDARLAKFLLLLAIELKSYQVIGFLLNANVKLDIVAFGIWFMENPLGGRSVFRKSLDDWRMRGLLHVYGVPVSGIIEMLKCIAFPLPNAILKCDFIQTLRRIAEDEVLELDINSRLIVLKYVKYDFRLWITYLWREKHGRHVPPTVRDLDIMGQSWINFGEINLESFLESLKQVAKKGKELEYSRLESSKASKKSSDNTSRQVNPKIKKLNSLFKPSRH